MRTLLLCFAAFVIAGCSLVGERPKEHTKIDYESLESHGAGDQAFGHYRYGHSGREHSGAGVDPDEKRP